MTDYREAMIFLKEYKFIINEIKREMISELRNDDVYIKGLSTDLMDDIAKDLFK